MKKLKLGYKQRKIIERRAYVRTPLFKIIYFLDCFGLSYLIMFVIMNSFGMIELNRDQNEFNLIMLITFTFIFGSTLNFTTVKIREYLNRRGTIILAAVMPLFWIFIGISLWAFFPPN